MARGCGDPAMNSIAGRLHAVTSRLSSGASCSMSSAGASGCSRCLKADYPVFHSMRALLRIYAMFRETYTVTTCRHVLQPRGVWAGCSSTFCAIEKMHGGNCVNYRWITKLIAQSCLRLTRRSAERLRRSGGRSCTCAADMCCIMWIPEALALESFVNACYLHPKDPPIMAAAG
jgi:hypothetical protein